MAVIDFLPDATFVIDADGKVIAWNRAMEELTGIDKASMIGKGNYEPAIAFYGERKPMLADLVLMPGEDVEHRYDHVEREGDTLVVDSFVPTLGPAGKHLWGKASPLYDDAGKVVGAIETIRDITDRKRAEQETERACRRLEEIIDFLPDATLVIDVDGKVIAWNRAIEEMTGINKQNMIGKGNYEPSIAFYGERKPMLADLVLMPGEAVEKRYDMVKRDGDTLVVDVFIPTFGPAGTYFWAKASPLYDDSGKVTGAIETIRDITDRKRAEQETERACRRLEEIIDFLPDATFVIDAEGKIIAWNRAIEHMTGICKGNMIGKCNYEPSICFYGERKPELADLVLMDCREVEQRYDTVKRNGDALEVDVFIPTFGPAGTYFWGKAGPLYDPAGNVAGAIETIRDVTERVLVEEKLARSKAELKIAAEIQRSFLPEHIPSIQGFDIAARSEMAREVGGDFFDVIPLEVIPIEKGTFGLLIADVSGKGIPAALFMALSRIVVRVNASRHPDPALVMRDANNIIAQNAKSGMFVTLFYGVLSEQNRTLTYVNAGHNPPLVFRRQDGSIVRLTPTGMFLGGLEHQEYKSGTVDIGPGDIAILYTDGITEAVNGSGELFGEERLKLIIRSQADLPAAGIIEKVFQSVACFVGDRPQSDDITVMVVKGTP